MIMPIKPFPDLLQVGEYTLDKTQFTLTHAEHRRGTGRKLRIEYPCDACSKLYVTKLRDEILKEHPWICRSCRTARYWQTPEYRQALEAGVTDKLRELRRIRRAETSKKMWADPEYRARMITALRARDPAVYSKGRSVMRKSSVTLHWVSGEEIVCVGTYERAFVDWCNRNQIDFDWQIPHKMPDGRTYIVDAFVKSGEYAGQWIEIKGYMSEIGQEKWSWFHGKHPHDSQLWNLPRLEELGIL